MGRPDNLCGAYIDRGELVGGDRVRLGPSH